MNSSTSEEHSRKGTNGKDHIGEGETQAEEVVDINYTTPETENFKIFCSVPDSLIARVIDKKNEELQRSYYPMESTTIINGEDLVIEEINERRKVTIAKGKKALGAKQVKWTRPGKYGPSWAAKVTPLRCQGRWALKWIGLI